MIIFIPQKEMMAGEIYALLCHLFSMMGNSDKSTNYGELVSMIEV
jgi:hypothetical protein